VENEVRTTKRYTVTETGVKFRVDLLRTPLKFLGKLGTTFWGFRARDPVPGGLELRQHRIRLRVRSRELVTPAFRPWATAP
jgi:hypothetical protein